MTIPFNMSTKTTADKSTQFTSNIDIFSNIRGKCNYSNCNCGQYQASQGLICSICEHRPVDHNLDGKKSESQSQPIENPINSQEKTGKVADENDDTIYFYERGADYYEFTNFFEGPPIIDDEGREWPTSEHLFQAQKFLPDHPELAEKIRMASSPRACFNLAHQFQPNVRADWRKNNNNIKAMDKALSFKFGTNQMLKEMLLKTGNKHLVERSPIDAFWGDGHDQKGRNELGKALMRLREEMRKEAAKKVVDPEV